MKKKSKKIGKIIAPIALGAGCLATIPATSCSGISIKHLAPYLHEITYDDYTYDVNEETTKGSGDASFGCSSVRKGNFYGRNFDYVFNDTPEFIVHVKANKAKNRHESIGVATHFGLREPLLLSGKYNRELQLIPNLTLDGINDAGLICSHNVVSMESTKNLEEEEIVPETNPDAPNKLHQLFVPRYVLDNAATVDEAIDLLTDENLNIQGSLNGKHFLHIMISDANKTVVVEFFNKNSAHNHFDVVVDQKIIDSVETNGREPIMTNYYVNNYKIDGGKKDNYYFLNDEKNGDERFAILKDGYEDVTDMASMRNLMQKAKFSIAFDLVGHNPIPLHAQSGKGDLTSEWYSENLTQSKLYEKPFDPEDYKDELKQMKEDYWKAINSDTRYPANPSWWITTHNSTYDMSELKLIVSVQENYLKVFEFSLKKK